MRGRDTSGAVDETEKRDKMTTVDTTEEKGEEEKEKKRWPAKSAKECQPRCLANSTADNDSQRSIIAHDKTQMDSLNNAIVACRGAICPSPRQLIKGPCELGRQHDLAICAPSVLSTEPTRRRLFDIIIPLPFGIKPVIEQGSRGHSHKHDRVQVSIVSRAVLLV